MQRSRKAGSLSCACRGFEVISEKSEITFRTHLIEGYDPFPPHSPLFGEVIRSTKVTHARDQHLPRPSGSSARMEFRAFVLFEPVRVTKCTTSDYGLRGRRIQGVSQLDLGSPSSPRCVAPARQVERCPRLREGGL